MNVFLKAVKPANAPKAVSYTHLYPRQWFINEKMTEIKEMTR